MELIPGAGKDSKLRVPCHHPLCLLSVFGHSLGGGRKDLKDFGIMRECTKEKSQKENIGNILKDMLSNFATNQCIFIYF